MYDKVTVQKMMLACLRRHTWMKDGVSYVGSGMYTIQEAEKMLKDEYKDLFNQETSATPYSRESYIEVGSKDFFVSACRTPSDITDINGELRFFGVKVVENSTLAANFVRGMTAGGTMIMGMHIAV